jgi:hypothetical protein
MTKTARSPRKLYDRLLILIFLAAIGLPPLASAIDSHLGENTTRGNWEKREFVRFPGWPQSVDALATFPEQFEEYYSDNFWPRSHLIRWHNWLKLIGFGLSPSEKVIVGKQGWLFYGDRDALDAYRRVNPFTKSELEQWRILLEKRHQWFGDRGIDYLFIIVPNKSTIYPEYMPSHIRRDARESRLDALVNYLETYSDFAILDLRGALLSAKQRDRVYHRTDSHWNKPGVFAAYRAIFAELNERFPGLTPLELDAFRREPIRRSGGDLAMMLGLENTLKEDAIRFSAMFPSRFRPASPGIIKAHLPENQQPFATEIDDRQLPRAVIFHDSFMLNLGPFLSEHFQRAVFLNQYEFDREIITRERPNLVIQEIAERTLMGSVPQD